jgi:integrase
VKAATETTVAQQRIHEALGVPVANRTAARLVAFVDPVFLSEVGWCPTTHVLSPPAGHPLLGWPVCRILGCHKIAWGTKQTCTTCLRQLRISGLSEQEFSVIPRSARNIGIGPCSVTGCGRPWASARARLCAHHKHQRVISQLGLERFLRHPDTKPLPGFGPCAVAACPRGRHAAPSPYCQAHHHRHTRRRRAEPELDEQHWQLTEPAVAKDGEVSLRGLSALVVVQVLYGLQQRTRDGIKTRSAQLRSVCDELRRHQSISLEQAPRPEAQPRREMLQSLATYARHALLDPETEKAKDIWELAAFGFTGRLTFTKISQPWLRTAVKRWAAHELPQRRGRNASGSIQGHINAMVRLSTSLRLARPDRGEIPAALGRVDVESFLHRLTHLQSATEISENTRIITCRLTRRVLSWIRTSGVTRPGQAAAGLPGDFSLTPVDVPAEPQGAEASRDLPREVLRQLCAHLAELESMSCREMRLAVELMIDTGRRPDEVCQLPWDCVDRDPTGEPVLVYENIKKQRMGRRLPIHEATAALITEQKTQVHQRFPGTPLAELTLLPSPMRNPHGRRAIADESVTERHRAWVDSLPVLLLDDGTEFDKSLVVPYSFRHCYAQRHADAGTPIDVLSRLMDHLSLDHTKRYYRVGEERRREAVARVASLQFDRHGNRIWREAKALLDSEHTRLATGEVVVPFGRCSEPSNVQAGGDHCPIRFRCVGCDHFNSDVSFLPDLRGYLADLLRNRERLKAMPEADKWAIAEAMPSEEEIDRVRRLIRCAEEGLNELTSEERAHIEEAVALVRKNRQVMLGLPRIRQPLPDIRPERPA